MSGPAAGIPASVGQRLLWMMQHYRGVNGALNCPVLLRLAGPLDVGALRLAVGDLVRRHESLRTVFVGRGPRLRQLVRPPRPVEIGCDDVTGAADPGAALRDRLLAELRAPIDTEVSPIRVLLVKCAAGEQVLCLNVHHFATDAWSNGILSRELGLAYEQALRGRITLPRPAWQFRDFLRNQQDELVGDRLARLQDHWRERLRGARFPDLPGERAGRRNVGAYTRLPIPGHSVAALVELCRSRRATLFAAMLTLYFVVIRRRTGDTDQAVVSLFANRTLPAAQQTVGFLANPLVLRGELPRRASFVELLDRVGSSVRDAFVHQALPYPMLPLDVLDTTAALDVVFQMFPEPVHQTVVAGLDVGPHPMPDGWGTRFDLDISVIPEGEGLALLAAYAVDRFAPAWVNSLLSDLVALAHQVVDGPETPLA